MNTVANQVTPDTLPDSLSSHSGEWLLEVDLKKERTAWVIFENLAASKYDELLSQFAKNSGIFVVQEVNSDFEPAVAEGHSDRIKVIRAGSVSEAARKLNDTIDRDIYDSWKPLISLKYAKANGAYIRDLMRAISEAFNSTNMKKGTVEHISNIFVQNTIRNSMRGDFYREFEPLKGSLKNRPAVIVSSGPSLNKQIPILKKSQHLLTVICVDSIWGLLLQNGIVPDIVVALDALNTPTWTPKTFSKDSLMFVDVGCHVKMFQSSGTAEIAMAHLPQLSSLSATLGHPSSFIPSGGSVSTTAFTIAHLLDANPIIFIGQDLGYTDGLDHAQGYQYAYNSALKDERSTLGFDTEGYYGGRIRTERQFLHYKTWFEEVIATLGNSKLIINSTEGGARIDGASQIPFSSVCDELATVYNTKPNLMDLCPPKALFSFQERLANLLSYKARVEKYIDLCKKGLTLCESFSIKQQEKFFKKIDKINRDLLLSDPVVKYSIDTLSNKNLDEVRRTVVRSDQEMSDIEKIKLSVDSYKEIYSHIHSDGKRLSKGLSQLIEHLTGEGENPNDSDYIWAIK